jgi:hypothetical protein
MKKGRKMFSGFRECKTKIYFTPLDLIEELAENTEMSYTTLFK